MIDVYKMPDVINAINNALNHGNKAELFVATDKFTDQDSVKVITVQRRLVASTRVDNETK